MTMLRRLNLMVFMLLTVAGTARSAEITFVAEDLPPIHFKNMQRQPDGFLVELANALVKNTTLSSRILLLPQARAYELTSTEPNVFMLSLLKSPQRDPDFQWVGAVYETRAFLIGLASNKSIQLHDLEDAKQYVVGTVRGYFSESWLRQKGFSDKHNLGLATQYDHLWGMLFKKHVDLVLTNALSLEREVQNAGYQAAQVQRYLELPELTTKLYIATGLQTDAALVERLSSALDTLKQQGTYAKLKAKWRL